MCKRNIFCIYLSSYHFLCSSFLGVYSDFQLLSFSFLLRDFSSVYSMMKVCWWMMNSFSFSWSKKVFCLCFWILIFVEFRILAWWKFFSFSVFFLLAYLVSSKKSAVIHIFVPLCVIQTFSLADFKILSSSLLLSNFLKQLQIPSFFLGGEVRRMLGFLEVFITLSFSWRSYRLHQIFSSVLSHPLGTVIEYIIRLLMNLKLLKFIHFFKF